MKTFDLAIIGGGPGGYTAAIRAAKSGLSVAVVEARDLGGTCLNRGCIPSKTLLQHASILNQIKDAKTFGITVKDYSFSIEDMIARKDKVIKQLRSGINGLLKQNKITLYRGYGAVDDGKTVTITSDNKEKHIKAAHIILANGSKPIVPELPGLDRISYETSDTIFDIDAVPSHMTIVGGGVIGLEIACIFQSLGSDVEIVEMADRILATEDPDASDFLAGKLTRDGITFHTQTKISGFEKNGVRAIVQMENKDGKQTLETDCVLLAVGRAPNVTGLEKLSIAYDGKFIKVDQNMHSSIPFIYAIGDLAGGYQLAHAANNEGIKAVSHILGNTSQKDSPIPRCVYTFPEIASVGMTENAAKEQGYNVKVSTIDLAANGKAIASGENNGFMKIIAEEKHGEILGVVMVGAHVTEMISQGTAFLHLEGTVEEVENMVFPHPTVAEGMFEAAASWIGKGIHYQ